MSDPIPELPEDLSARYRVARELGRGAFGRVLLAHRREDERPVAIKLLVADVAQQPVVRERFSREGRAGSRLDHPNVVQVLEVGGAETPYLVQEFVAGGSLEERLEAHPRGLDPEEAARILDGILAGLQAAHQQGLTHRDLKPANILLDEQGRPKLADFGLAHGAFEATLTATGTILGTPLYMAPGQVLGEKPTPAWDVYAAAAIYYEMLLGRPAFDGDNLADILDAKRRGLVAGPVAQGAAAPPALDRLLRSALGRSHAVDFPDVASFRRVWTAIDRLPEAGAGTLEDQDERVARTAVLGAPAGSGETSVQAAPRGPAPEPVPPPVASPGSVWTRAGVAAVLAAALGIGWHMGSPAPVPEPDGAGTSRRAPSSLELLRLSTELKDLRRRVAADPQIQEALLLEGLDQPEAVGEDFRDAQEAIDNLLGAVDLPALLARVEEGLVLPPAAREALLEVVGVQHLLSRAKFGELAEDSGGVRQRAVDEAFRRLVRMRRVERGYLPNSSQDLPPEGIRHTLERDGETSTWQLLRGYHDLPKHLDDRGIPRANNRVWRLTPQGRRFEDPVGEVASIVVSSMGLRRDRRLIEMASDGFAEEFTALPPGDLELVFATDGLDATVQSLLTLIGAERQVEVPLWFDLEQHRGFPEPDAGGRSWHRVWIHRALVPEGVRGLRMRFRGIQPMTDGEAVVYFTELWLRVD